MTVIAVLLAGAVGAAMRYLVSLAFAGRGFPWGILVVNVVGCAIGGVVLGFAVSADLSRDIQLIVLTGLCGGLTTFSTWSVEAIQLAQDGKLRLAVLHVAGNLVLGLAAAAAGFAVVLVVT